MFNSVGRHSVENADELALGDAFAELAPRLRAALTPLADAASVDDGVGEAFVYLCANHERVLAMDNPGGYLYRVARSRLGRRRKDPVLPPVPDSAQPYVEPGLPKALAGLSERQRVALYLIAGMGWTAVEVGAYLDLGESSVRTHYDRGMAKLRAQLGEAER